MDISTSNPAGGSAPRRSEEIALDLLKFVATHANLGSKSAGSTAGFGVPSAVKSEDQVAQIFELYARCRAAVESSDPTVTAKP